MCNRCVRDPARIFTWHLRAQRVVPAFSRRSVIIVYVSFRGCSLAPRSGVPKSLCTSGVRSVGSLPRKEPATKNLRPPSRSSFSGETLSPVVILGKFRSAPAPAYPPGYRCTAVGSTFRGGWISPAASLSKIKSALALASSSRKFLQTKV